MLEKERLRSTKRKELAGVAHLGSRVIFKIVQEEPRASIREVTDLLLLIAKSLSNLMAGRSMSENGGRMMSRLVVWDWVWNLDPRPKGPLYVAQCLRNVTEPLEAHQIGISLGTV